MKTVIVTLLAVCVALAQVPVPSTSIGGGASAVTVLSVQNSSADTITCSVVGAAAETNFVTTYTIPANYLTANKLLRVTYSGTLTATAAFVWTDTKLKLCPSGACTGTNALIATGSATIGSIRTNVASSFSFLIQGTAAPGASVNVEGGVASIGGQSPWSSPATSLTQPIAFATNGALTIQLAQTCGANTAGNSISVRQMVVEALN